MDLWHLRNPYVRQSLLGKTLTLFQGKITGCGVVANNCLVLYVTMLVSDKLLDVSIVAPVN